MSRYFLRQLRIEGFRGINNQGDPLVLDFDIAKVTSIFGRNGMGKSSTFEALAYAIAGEVPRLASMQQRVENPATYYLNKFHKGPATISLVFEADDSGTQVLVTVSRDEEGRRSVAAVGSPDAEAFLREVNCETLLLDYSSFNEFVLSKPIDRGRAFSKLLGLNQLSVLRAALDALSDTRNLNNDLETRALQERLVAAQRAKGAAVTAGLRALSRVVTREFTEKDFEPATIEAICLAALKDNPVTGPLITGPTLGDVDFEACRRKVEESEGAPQRKLLGDLLTKRAALEEDVELSIFEAELERVVADLLKRNEMVEASKGEAFKELYTAAEKTVQSGWTTDQCPLCETSWAHPSGLDLSGFVSTQLSAFKGILDLDQTIGMAWSEITRKASTLKATQVLVSVGSLQDAPAAITQSPRATLPSEDDVTRLRAALRQVDTERVKALEVLGSSIARLQATLPESLVSSVNTVVGAEELATVIMQYQAADLLAKETEREIAAANQWRHFVKGVADEYAEAESLLVRETTELLEQDIRAIYNSIMPGSDILPKLKREEDSERLHLKLERFFGLNDVDAVPLLSESYRNAMGLAIFLAASRRRHYGGRFLVLDDVTSSFDAGHQAFLVQAVYNHVARPQDPDGLQVVFLSHDGLLEKLFDQASSNGWEWTSVKLHGLPPAGLVHGSRTAGSRIKSAVEQRLAQGDVDGALPLVRQYLEFRLMEVIRILGIRVPLDFSTKEDKRMVGNMLEAVKFELDVQQRLGTLIMTASQVALVTGTILPTLIGNWVQHYETGATVNFSPGVVRGVIGAVDNLGSAFQYTCRCTTPPREKYYRSLSEKHKGCGASCV